MTDETLLLDAIKGLTTEVHDLTKRFSAEEVLAKKAADLAVTAKNVAKRLRNVLIALCVVVAIVILAVIKIFQLADQNREIAQCQAQFNKATEQRSSLVTGYTSDQSDAMEDLVKARGLPNDEVIIKARDKWLEATWMLAEAKRLNPVVKYEDYCKPVKGVDAPKVPPAVKPDPTLYPGPQPLEP